MKTATLRELRHDFGSVFACVEQGQPVGISRRGKIIALLTPPPRPKPAKPKKRPDFAARLKGSESRTLLPDFKVADAWNKEFRVNH